MDIYKKILDYCRSKQPARCWFDYPPTYVLFHKINFSDMRKSINKLLNSKEKVGLYLNVPFCANRCTYCMYYSESVSKQNRVHRLDKYLDALEREIDLLRINFKKRKLRHLYIGGGTPLLLSPKQLSRLFKIINNNFLFDSDSQFVIEGRPKNFTKEKLMILKRNNINRVTIGVQSFNEKTIKKVGRDYIVKDIYSAFSRIRAAGIKYINTDIIVGLPGETRRDHKNTIRHLLKLSPDSISCTSILYGKRTLIKKKNWLSDEIVKKYYKFFDSTFRQNNFLPAVEDKEGIYLRKGDRNADNKLLFNNLCGGGYILGIGSGAVSYLLDVRYYTDMVNSYTEALKKGNSPTYYGMFLDKDDIMRQYLILQLYLFHKVKIDEFNKKFSLDLMKVYGKEINNLAKNGVVKIKPSDGLIILMKESKELKNFLYNMLKFIFRQDYINRLTEEVSDSRANN